MTRSIKKIWAFQKLISMSLNQAGFEIYEQRISGKTGCGSYIWFFIFVSIFSSLIQNLGMFFFGFIAVLSAYFSIQGRKKLFMLVPISRKFMIFNLYLMPLLSSILAFLVVEAFIILLVAVIWGIVLILKVPQDNATELSVSLTSVHAVLFCIMLLIISIFTFIAIAVIRRDKIRHVSIAVLSSIFIALSFWLKNALPQNDIITIDLGFSCILPGFEKIPYVNMILAVTAVIMCIIIPLSIWFVNREFMRDIVKKPI